MSWMERLKFSLLHHVPLYVARGNLWWLIEMFRRKLHAIGMPPEGEKCPDAGSSVNMKPLTESEFDSEARAELERGSALNPPVLEMLREARAKGISFVVVEMPVRQNHLCMYDHPVWTRYAVELRRLIETQGGIYVDGSRWIDDPSKFWDEVHLNERGGRSFSYELAEYLRDQRHSINAASVSCYPWNLSHR